MRRISLALAVPAVALGVGFSSTAFSQGRTIEETLVVSDPTVAAAGKWKVGGAAEYWWVRTTYNIVDSNGNDVGDATLTFKQPGWNVFAAYGNVTVQATRRSGSGDFTGNQGTLTYTGPQKSTDTEFTARWLFPGRAVSPYLLVGYATTKLEQTRTITSAGNWACSNSKTLQTNTEYKGPLVGGGAIVPFSEKFGVRGDLRLKWNKGTQTENGSNAFCDSGSSSGLGYDATVTGYWNIVGGLNAQLGIKFQQLNGGSEVDNWFRTGLFGMLGYTVKF
ncbi:MAG: hypothetical protein QOD26_1760 [Betaproteobacteria bacterium]|nr:hypothetical protein [Betaproteobacteria bacterium]